MYQPDRQRAPRRRSGKWSVLLIVVLAAVPLYYFGSGAYDLYSYRTGTPATATAIHCRSHRGGFVANSSAQVHVKGDTAYTADASTWRFIAGAIATGLIAFFLLWARWIGRARRRYRDRALPTQT